MICPNCQYDIKTRTGAQNRSLHLFFEWIANMFNQDGITHISNMGIETPWTKEIVKYDIWKPLQLSVYGHDSDSTRKLTPKMINLLADAIIDHYSKIGYTLEFPSMETFLNAMDKKNYLK